MMASCAEFYQTPKQGFFFGFVFQFCDVVEVVIIHKMIYPGLTKLDMVVEKTQNPSIGQNPLNRSKSYFSPQNLAKFHQERNTAPKVLALLLDESQLFRTLWVCYWSKHLKQGCIES
jgi:hypothetical protein